MWIYIAFSIFGLCINNSFFAINENLLLCIIFIFFFLLITIYLKRNIKKSVFLKIFKLYYLNILVIKIGQNLNLKALMIYAIRRKCIELYIIKVNKIKKKLKFKDKVIVYLWIYKINNFFIENILYKYINKKISNDPIYL